MREILVSFPTAVSGGMRLYAAFLLLGHPPELSLISAAFFLTLAIYGLDRLEDYDGGPVPSLLFSRLGRASTPGEASPRSHSCSWQPATSTRSA